MDDLAIECNFDSKATLVILYAWLNSFDMLSIGVCTTRRLQTSGRRKCLYCSLFVCVLFLDICFLICLSFMITLFVYLFVCLMLISLFVSFAGTCGFGYQTIFRGTSVATPSPTPPQSSSAAPWPYTRTTSRKWDFLTRT